MKSIGIATDSHSGITKEEADQLGIRIVPMPFIIEGETYYEGEKLSKNEFYDMLRKGADVRTSQPNILDVRKVWDEMLEEYEEVLYLPISSGLSGSCMTAQAMAEEPEYAGRIMVVDCGRVSATLHRSVLDAHEMIEEGYSAEEIRRILEESREDMIIYVAVSTLEYLKRGGRIRPSVAQIANILNIKPVMRFGVGTLDVFQKCRGIKKARNVMIEAMKNELNTTFRDAYQAGEIYLLAASSSTPEVTEEWIDQIRDAFPDLDVMCDDLTFGLSCHIGPDGLGIGCSCRPRR